VDRLYTPWRLAYVTEASIVTPECIFCAALAAGDRETLIIHRGRRTFVILNKFPYNNGHVMVVPVRHAGHLTELDHDELHELMELTQTAERALTATYGPHGFNMGLNLGKPAGAGVLNHLHMHVVPRWSGDANFITIIGGSKVVPQLLRETRELLAAEWARQS